MFVVFGELPSRLCSEYTIDCEIAVQEYYEPNKGRPNLVAITGARVTRVVFRPKSDAEELVADGLEYVQDGETYTILAKKEVIICAGKRNIMLFVGL